MVDIQSVTFSGSCDENYLEIRLSTETGRIIERFCAGTENNRITEPVITNSNGVFVKWKKQKDSASASFTGKWSTKALTCCNKVTLQNLFQYSGDYIMDSTSGVYRQEEGVNILFQKVNQLGFSGWFIGSDKKSIALINPVILYIIFNSS